MSTAGRAGAGATAAIVIAMASTLFLPSEGRRYVPYRDIVGVVTVCNGHTGHDIENRRYTDAECDAFADKDLREAYVHVHRCIPEDAPVEVQAALTDMTANLGPRAVCGSTIQRVARRHDWKSVCAGILAWINAGGKPSNGMANRRIDEREMCLRYAR